MCTEAQEKLANQALVKITYESVKEHGVHGEFRGLSVYGQEVFDEHNDYRGLLVFIPYSSTRVHDAIREY